VGDGADHETLGQGVDGGREAGQVRLEGGEEGDPDGAEQREQDPAGEVRHFAGDGVELDQVPAEDTGHEQQHQ
jgi:hypothetical protein